MILLSSRKARERAVLISGSILASIVLAEILGGLFDLEPYEIWDTDLRNLNVIFKTEEFNTKVVTNRQGLREPRDIAMEHPQTFRIIVVGDSMTFGWGVEYDEAYPKVAEHILRMKYGLRNLEVINMGRPGHSPERYLKSIWQYGSRLHPDLIVVGFLLLNDFPIHPRIQAYSPKQVRTLINQHVAYSRKSDSRGGLLWRSFVFRLLYRRVIQPVRERRIRGFLRRNLSEGLPDPLFNAPNPLGLSQIVRGFESAENLTGAQMRYRKLRRSGLVKKGLDWSINPYRIWEAIFYPNMYADSQFLRPEMHKAMQSEWEVLKGVLLEMKVASTESKSRLVILLVPHILQVDQKGISFAKQMGFLATETFRYGRVVNDLLLNFCRENELICFDPLEKFRAEADAGRQLYYVKDAHLTAEGHRLLGESLADSLAQLSIISK